MRICALIAAYNEAAHIASVVRAAAGQVDRVVLVDDGSDDGTPEMAASAGAVCLRLPRNRGKAAALRHGLDYLRGRDFTHVLFLDGDGQHLPADIPALIRAASETGADLVLGARSFDRARMPRSRHFSNTVGSRVASWLVGRPIRDSQCGFRLARLEPLGKLRLRSRRYEFEMEVLIKLARAGASIVHAPVGLVYDGGRARSKMRVVRDTIRICLWSLAYRFAGL